MNTIFNAGGPDSEPDWTIDAETMIVNEIWQNIQDYVTKQETKIDIPLITLSLPVDTRYGVKELSIGIIFKNENECRVLLALTNTPGVNNYGAIYFKDCNPQTVTMQELNVFVAEYFAGKMHDLALEIGVRGSVRNEFRDILFPDPIKDVDEPHDGDDVPPTESE